MRKLGIGLAVLVAFVAPGAVGTLIANHYYGERAQVIGAGIPYMIAFLLFIAYAIGDVFDQ